jgi:hypothetical protein
MKVRLFQGMVPMTGETWARKQLDDPENCALACEYLETVVGVFQYLNQSDVQTKLRDTFNLISSDLRDLDFALMMRRQEQGSTPVSSAALWAEYFYDLFSLVTTRAHSWILDRVRGLNDMYTAEFLSISPDEDGYMSHALQFVQRTRMLVRVMSAADCAIVLPMDGYNGYRTRPPGPVPNYDSRVESYEAKMNASPVVDELVDMLQLENRTLARWEDQQKILDLLSKDEDNRNEVRRQVRGVDMGRHGPEMWIKTVESDMHHTGANHWGFVAYRLCYKETDEEWTSFVQTLESDMNGWGEWIDGVEEIKAKAIVHWLDGQKLGIPPGDVQAAKRYVKRIFPTKLPD